MAQNQRPLLRALVAGLLLAASASTAAQPPPPAAPEYALSYSLRELGLGQDAQLRGVDGSLWLPFGVRRDEAVTRARLTLRYTASPALLPDISHLRLSLNGETLATLPLPRDKAGSEAIASFDLDPRYFTDYNQLRLQLIGHYTLECEDPLHSSLWTSVSADSTLELALQPLALPDDLSLLPEPFFDARDNRRVELPFSFAAKPDLDTLRAAAVLASWYGALASYRGARFEALPDRLPTRHGLVLATNTAAPAGLDLQPVERPTVSLRSHPTLPGVKLLVLQGRDGAQLVEAAQALALGQVVLGGSRAVVEELRLPPRRAAYDAPLWVRTDRPVKFGELVREPSELQTAGFNAAPIRINLRLPPDLLTWRTAGVPIDLRYRYTTPVEQDNSLMSVSINEEFVQAFRLRPQTEQDNATQLLVPLLDKDPGSLSDPVLLPAFQVGADNQLQFRFALDNHKRGLCQGAATDLSRAAIDPDSTVDLSRFPHYTALPNLALFANAGFPFTKYADLAETLVVLADAPAARDIEDLLFLMGRMGRQTGATATRVQLVGASQLPPKTDADLLVIGGRNGRDLLKEWESRLPVTLDDGRRSLQPRKPATWLPRSLLETADPQAPGTIAVQAQGAMAALLALESPLQAGRSAVVVTATAPEARPLALDVLEDGALVRQVRGDTVLIRGREVSSFRGEDTYYVGELPWRLQIWLYLARYPLLIVLFAVIAALLGTGLVYRYLQRRAAQRLQG